jgi:hypothetical protein
LKSEELDGAVKEVTEFLTTDPSVKTVESPNEPNDTKENKNKRSVPEASGVSKKARGDQNIEIPTIPRRSAASSNNGVASRHASMDSSIPKRSNSGAKKGFNIKAFCNNNAGPAPRATSNTIEASHVHAWTSQAITHSYADFESSPWNQPGDSDIIMSLVEPALPTKEEVRNMFFRNQ